MNPIYRLSNWYFSQNALPYWCILLADSSAVIASGLLTRYWLVGGKVFAVTFWPMMLGLLLTLFIYIIFFRLLKTYCALLRYSGFADLSRIALANISGGITSIVVGVVLSIFDIPQSLIIVPTWPDQLIIVLLSTLTIWLVRILAKNLYEQVRSANTTNRAFIYGIKDGGVSLAKSLRTQYPNRYRIKGFIAPVSADPLSMPDYLLGSTVISENDPMLIERLTHYQITHLIISPLQTEHFREQSTLINQVVRKGIHIMMLPEAFEWDGHSELPDEQLREVDIEDLLPREKIEVDLNAIGSLLRDRTILITGAAGSIGNEMVQQVAKFAPAQLILIDQAETPMHDVRLFMAKNYAYIPCRTIVASITNQAKMEALFATYRPDYVFHAAAYKHVPMMEDNPSVAVQNNIYGTRVIADLAVKYGTRKFVMISTDKAVNPTNVMGCSKRICEIYCQSLNKAIQDGTIQGRTQFITTRFGNVLGSNGSVIPIFKEQIRRGGPVTVTHPDIIRYFMLIPEACRLVLEAGTMGHGGEIFIFDMGLPVRIADLAQRMIDLSGAKNVSIAFTGLRDGEKLYEEVLADAEKTKPTTHPKIMIAEVREYDYALALRNEEELLQLSYTEDDMAIVRKMKQIVPEYKSQHSKYQVLDKQA